MVRYQMPNVTDDLENDNEVLHATLPSSPGTKLVYVHDDGAVSYSTVVLWGVLHDGTPVPITMSGVWDGCEHDKRFVLHPDGSCSRWEEEWRTQSEALNAIRS